MLKKNLLKDFLSIREILKYSSIAIPSSRFAYALGPAHLTKVKPISFPTNVLNASLLSHSNPTHFGAVLNSYVSIPFSWHHSINAFAVYSSDSFSHAGPSKNITSGSNAS